MKTLKASLFASAIGTAASILGVTHRIWPTHPQLALLLLTVGATAILLYVEPAPAK